MSATASRRSYALAYAALLALTGVTVAAAYLELGTLGTVVALAIAGAKALVVVFAFMHVRACAGLERIAVVAGAFWLGILLVLTLSDFLTRGWPA